MLIVHLRGSRCVLLLGSARVRPAVLVHAAVVAPIRATATASEGRSVVAPNVVPLRPLHATLGRTATAGSTILMITMLAASAAAPVVLAAKFTAPSARTIATHAPAATLAATAASGASQATATVVVEVELDFQHLLAALATGRCLLSIVVFIVLRFRLASLDRFPVQRNHLVPLSRILALASLAQVVLGLQSDGRLLCFPLVQRHFLGLILRFGIRGTVSSLALAAVRCVRAFRVGLLVRARVGILRLVLLVLQVRELLGVLLRAAPVVRPGTVPLVHRLDACFVRARLAVQFALAAPVEALRATASSTAVLRVRFSLSIVEVTGFAILIIVATAATGS
uniref:Uncharacterized protein n=1 Tax=Anopheles atroparvus TaxID=41427 RepID=A0AAG5CR90_ANOAO